MSEKSKKLLVQMQAIIDFTGLTKETIKKLVEDVGFPAVKKGGTWYSHTDAIEDWMYDNCYPISKRKRVKK